MNGGHSNAHNARCLAIHRSAIGKKKIKGNNGELEFNLSHKS